MAHVADQPENGANERKSYPNTEKKSQTQQRSLEFLDPTRPEMISNGDVFSLMNYTLPFLCVRWSALSLSSDEEFSWTTIAVQLSSRSWLPKSKQNIHPMPQCLSLPVMSRHWSIRAWQAGKGRLFPSSLSVGNEGLGKQAKPCFHLFWLLIIFLHFHHLLCSYCSSEALLA